MPLQWYLRKIIILGSGQDLKHDPERAVISTVLRFNVVRRGGIVVTVAILNSASRGFTHHVHVLEQDGLAYSQCSTDDNLN